MRQRVILNWAPSSFHGWGVYGLNLALAWAADPEIEPVISHVVQPEHLVIDALKIRRLSPVVQGSAAFQARLAAHAGGTATSGLPVLASCGGSFSPGRVAHQVALHGTPTIAVTFFETAELAPEAVARARSFPLIVTGSTWNEAVLRAHGVDAVKTVLQGIDPGLFHPAPRLGVMPGKFLVFSGGKLEARKGQDIVLAAFRRFVERRPDAVLATAWHSPVDRAAATVDASGLAAPLPFDGEGRPDVRAWAAANGLAEGNFIDLGVLPNALAPQVLREMDVAVFPNRAEGGTNLVAMEAMACGVPAILSANTGHLDLIEADNAYRLERQRTDALGWGDSDVDEVVARLEEAYADREAARARGLRGAATLAGMTWTHTAQAMKAVVLQSLSQAR
jgi:glycosyltransferase involved in cell wall biosynthesis